MPNFDDHYPERLMTSPEEVQSAYARAKQEFRPEDLHEYLQFEEDWHPLSTVIEELEQLEDQEARRSA